jgi:hypothetical protein
MCCDMSASMKLAVSDSFVHVSNDAQLLMIVLLTIQAKHSNFV